MSLWLAEGLEPTYKNWSSADINDILFSFFFIILYKSHYLQILQGKQKGFVDCITVKNTIKSETIFKIIGVSLEKINRKLFNRILISVFFFDSFIN
jgi:hypothetical protein